MNQDVVSFVLRFVREEADGQPARWRGVIKHVQSDHTADFARFGDALAFMQDHLNETIRQAFAGDETPSPEHIFAETARLWGEMAPRYTDIMLQSMELMLEQGRRMGESMADSLARGTASAHSTGQDQQAQLIGIIERLTNQVEALSAKVDHLEGRLRDD